MIQSLNSKHYVIYMIIAFLLYKTQYWHVTRPGACIQLVF